MGAEAREEGGRGGRGGEGHEGRGEIARGGGLLPFSPSSSTSEGWQVLLSVPTALLLALLSLLYGLTAAKEFLVDGNANAWSVPSSSQALNKWAETNHFSIDDSLVWKYDAKKDSVMQVSREAYLNSNRSAPLAVYREGNTAVELAKSGPYYFISDAKAGCRKGQKLIVVVMSERCDRLAAEASPAPLPTVEFEGPATES